MAWGQEKGADFHISALRACQYEIFDFVPCSLPLKTLILLTFSCFLIRRRGKDAPFFRYFMSALSSFSPTVAMRASVISRSLEMTDARAARDEPMVTPLLIFFIVEPPRLRCAPRRSVGLTVSPR